MAYRSSRRNPHLQCGTTDLGAGAFVEVIPDFLDGETALAVFSALTEELALGPHEIQLFGRSVMEPRLSAYHALPGRAYRYSGRLREPHPLTPTLLELLDRLDRALSVRFDAVLCNLYRDGRDAMGWHADDEPVFGPQPTIASLSLGAPRRFLLRAREDGATVETVLRSGMLLVMRGRTQKTHRHAVPKTAKSVGPRLNLTFRRFVDP